MSLCLNSLVTRQLRKLSVGLPLTSVRCAAIKKAAGKTDHPFTPGFGERIYLFHHILDGITVYSSMPILVVCPCPCLATTLPLASPRLPRPH